MVHFNLKRNDHNYNNINTLATRKNVGGPGQANSCPTAPNLAGRPNDFSGDFEEISVILLSRSVALQVEIYAI